MLLEVVFLIFESGYSFKQETVVVKKIYNHNEFDLDIDFFLSVWRVLPVNSMCLIYLLSVIILVFSYYSLMLSNHN